MRALRRLLGFVDADGGVSSIEFTMVFPVLMVILLAGNQVVLYIDATRKVEQIATSVSEMISQATPPTSGGDGSASVNSTDLNFSYDSTLVIFPYVMGDALRRNIPWRQTITVSFAGITFNQISTSCTGATDQSPCYLAHVDWTSVGTSSASYRPCLVPQQPTDDTAGYSRYLLPRSVFGSGSIVAVDVTYTFTPTFGTSFVSPITINRSVFVQPRYATKIKYDPTGTDGIASTCLL